MPKPATKFRCQYSLQRLGSSGPGKVFDPNDLVVHLGVKSCHFYSSSVWQRLASLLLLLQKSQFVLPIPTSQNRRGIFALVITIRRRSGNSSSISLAWTLVTWKLPANLPDISRWENLFSISVAFWIPSMPPKIESIPKCELIFFVTLPVTATKDEDNNHNTHRVEQYNIIIQYYTYHDHQLQYQEKR